MNLHSLETTPGSRKNRHRVGRGDGSGWGGTRYTSSRRTMTAA